MYCDLGGGEDYETFHAASREQVTNLKKHVEARAEQMYISTLNTNWY